jgi:diguanylate cyclase (GGDEF)-like protein/PAS domain S-box-containing protein
VSAATIALEKASDASARTVARLSAERSKRAAEVPFRRGRYAFDHNPNPMLLLEAATLRYVDVNQAAVDAYGYTREQFLTMGPYDLRAAGHMEGVADALSGFDRDASNTLDTVHLRADGSRLDAHLTVVTVEHGDDRVYIVTVQDMTERNDVLARALRSEAQLAHDTLHDRLTGLPNRTLLNDRLAAAVERARERNHMTAVLFIDIDEFKAVNDTMGHSAGDALLKEIAHRLRSNARQVDCLARMGGDEFIAVLGDITSVDHVAEIARHLAHVTAEPIRIVGGEVRATCSIGIAMFPRDGDDAETLIRNADTAMYQAKREGRATACFFTPAMHHVAEQRLRLQGRLQKALEENAFELVYQPIYKMDGALRSSEALIRWPQSDGTVVPPNDFIPYAEESGLIVPIGAWVLQTACRQSAKWCRANWPLRVSVNVSGKQLADPNFVQTVRQALRSANLPPELLELELTESVMTVNVERTAAVVRELHDFGVRIAIDDFGTGYNTLATLRSYVVDTLKLDMCFVVDIVKSSVDQAIASAVIAAAHGLGAKVIAEGVETAAQSAVLTALKCDAVQGFLFARPMSAKQFGELLRAESAGPIYA